MTSRIFEFDPAEIGRMYVQDTLVADHGMYPWWPAKPIFDREMMPINIIVDEKPDGAVFVVWQPDFNGWFKFDLGQFILDLRQAMKLPFCDDFLAWMRSLLEGAEEEARKRIRAPLATSNDAWRSADFLGEVETVCGQGRRSGGQFWFKCPFHDDRSPSLEVDADNKLWHCWGCGKAGGVYAWRRLISPR